MLNDAMDYGPIGAHDAPRAGSSATPRLAEQPPRRVFVPLLALLLVALLTQLATLPYIMGRSGQMPGATEQSVPYMVIVTIVIVSMITIPLAGLGLWLGGRIGLGAPLLIDLLERRPGAGRRLRQEAKLAIPLGLGVGALAAVVRMVGMPALSGLEHPGALAGLLASAGAAVSEKIWIRLGLMTVIAWPVVRLLGQAEVRPDMWSLIEQRT